jgi:hypothetical protein
VQTRSAVSVDACEKYVPAGHVADCDWHATATFTSIVDAEAFTAKDPAAHGVQTRSAVVVEAAA